MLLATAACDSHPVHQIPIPPALAPIYTTIADHHVFVLYTGPAPLYYNTADSSTQITCTGPCTRTWQPLLARNMPPGQLPPVNLEPGHVTFYNGPNGRQAEYNGHPLYTYAHDIPQRPPRGQGIDGTWFAVTPALVPRQATFARPLLQRSRSS